MIRRLFTILSLLLFLLAISVCGYPIFANDDDPRILLGSLKIIVHKDHRIAIRIAAGAFHVFDLWLLYVPAVAFFLIAIAWNAASHYRRASTAPPNPHPQEQTMTVKRRSGLEKVFISLIAALILFLLWLILLAITYRK